MHEWRLTDGQREHLVDFIQTLNGLVVCLFMQSLTTTWLPWHSCCNIVVTAGEGVQFFVYLGYHDYLSNFNLTQSLV